MAKEKIVVIDDSPIVRKLAELALEEEGYKVYTAEDGEEGLRISEEVRPSVILVDFIMPRISGYQFCKSARENELLKDIPIILITGKGEDVGKKFAEKFGVVDYFIKPFKSEMLVEKVNSIVHAQRQQLGEEADIFERAEAPAPETPTYSFETHEFAEEPTFAAEPIAELTETPSTESAVKFDETDIFSEAKPAETIEEIGMPEYTFESLGVPPAEEIQEPDVKQTEEPELTTSSFDFDLEGLATQEVEIDEQGKIGAPVMPEVRDVYDFEAMLVSEAAPAEEVVKPVPMGISGMRAELPTDVPGLEAAVDSVMRKYFSYELPILIEKSIEDILKQHNIIKQSSILLSGSLQDVSSVDIFRMIDSGELTGKFFAFAPEGSAEIYFEGGQVVHGLTSKHGRTLASGRLALMGQGLSGEIEEGLKEETLDALRMIAGLKDGGFFFEKMAIPAALLDFQRTNVISLLLEALRKKEDGTKGAGDDGIYTKLVSEIAVREYNLNDMEQELFSLADGVRSVSNIALLSGLEMAEARKTLCRLAKAGVLRYKGGF